MKTILVLRTLLVIHLHCFCVFCHVERNDRGMFENVAGTEKLFAMETSTLLPKLLALKDLLKKKLTLLKATTSCTSLEEIYGKVITINEVISETSSEVDLSDYKGALRGLMILVDSYDLNLEDFVHGNIRARGQTDVNFKSRHSLTVADLGNLASEAYEYRWYDTAILILKQAFALHHLNPNTILEQQFKQIVQLKKHIVEYHNQMLKKQKKQWGEGFKLLPYIVDDNLQPSKKQPKFVKTLSFARNRMNVEDSDVGNEKQKEAGRRICRMNLTGQHVLSQQNLLQCHFLHHNDPYLRLGPHKVEELLSEPVRMIIHDFLEEKEINWLLEYSEPLVSDAIQDINKQEQEEKRRGISKKVRNVQQSFYTYIKMVQYKEKEQYDQKTGLLPLKDPYTMTIIHPILYRLAWKIEVATRLKVRGRFSAGDFSVSSYGLSGLMGSHMDAVGPTEGRELAPNQIHVKGTGDTLYTFQAWLNDVEAGGATAFVSPDYEQAVWPTRGSAAVWVNLDRKGHWDLRASHTGCPILKGSKWILNHWITYYDQVQEYPCGLYPYEAYKMFTKHY